MWKTLKFYCNPLDGRYEDLTKGKWYLNVFRDFTAGLIVAMIAIPLAMGLAIASGLKPEMGIIGGAVAALVGAAFGGSKYQVYGPTAAFIPIIAGLMGKYGSADPDAGHAFLVLASMICRRGADRVWDGSAGADRRLGSALHRRRLHDRHRRRHRPLASRRNARPAAQDGLPLHGQGARHLRADWFGQLVRRDDRPLDLRHHQGTAQDFGVHPRPDHRAGHRRPAVLHGLARRGAGPHQGSLRRDPHQPVQADRTGPAGTDGAGHPRPRLLRRGDRVCLGRRKPALLADGGSARGKRGDAVQPGQGTVGPGLGAGHRSAC